MEDVHCSGNQFDFHTFDEASDTNVDSNEAVEFNGEKCLRLLDDDVTESLFSECTMDNMFSNAFLNIEQYFKEGSDEKFIEDSETNLPMVFAKSEKRGRNYRSLSMESATSDEFESSLCQQLISDEDLINLSVSQLNHLFKNIPKEQSNILKARRRKLKNRGYAQVCRSKMMTEMSTLLKEKIKLHEELDNMVVKYKKLEKEHVKLKKDNTQIMADRNKFRTLYEKQIKM